MHFSVRLEETFQGLSVQVGFSVNTAYNGVLTLCEMIALKLPTSIEATNAYVLKCPAKYNYFTARLKSQSFLIGSLKSRLRDLPAEFESPLPRLIFFH